MASPSHPLPSRPAAAVAACAAIAVALTVLLAACSGGGGGDVELSAQGAKGKVVAKEQGCTSCHTTSGARSTGPTWKDLAGSQVELQGGKTVTADDAYLRRSILRSREQVVKGYPNIMPVYSQVLTDAQVDQLIASLHDLSPEDGAGS